MAWVVLPTLKWVASRIEAASAFDVPSVRRDFPEKRPISSTANSGILKNL
jgi:hypothetical protein